MQQNSSISSSPSKGNRFASQDLIFIFSQAISAAIFGAISGLLLLGGMGHSLPLPLGWTILFGFIYFSLFVDAAVFALSCVRLICLVFKVSCFNSISRWDNWLLAIPGLLSCGVMILLAIIWFG